LGILADAKDVIAAMQEDAAGRIDAAYRDGITARVAGN
jgi:hypothetical protein